MKVASIWAAVRRWRPRLWHTWRHGYCELRYIAEWPAFAGENWPQRIMDWPVTDRLHCKQGRSIGRRILVGPRGELRVYLKRHYVLPWYRRLLGLLWPQRAWSPGLQEWERLQWAAAQGVAVPHAVAAGQWCGPGWRLQSFLAVAELVGMLPLHEAVPLAAGRLSPRQFEQWKREVIAELARVVAALHRRRMFHKDLYLCHFYVPEPCAGRDMASAPPRVVLIDLHRLAEHHWTAWWWQAKDLAQLLFSSAVEGIGSRDRLRFWRAYCRQLSPGWRRMWLQRAVLIKAGLYRRHARRVKRRELWTSRCATSG